jgi:hypothetical protein
MFFSYLYTTLIFVCNDVTAGPVQTLCVPNDIQLQFIFSLIVVSMWISHFYANPYLSLTESESSNLMEMNADF